MTNAQCSPLLDYLLAKAWAMDQGVLKQLAAIVVRHVQGVRLSDEEVAAVVAGREDRVPAPSSTLDVVGSVAVIPIAGVIAKYARQVNGASQPRGTSTQAVGKTLREALARPDVKSILLNVDSPGGTVDGVTELADLVHAAREQKPIVTYANGLMASAALWIGSQANRVVASRDAAVGSIGVYVAIQDLSRLAKNEGVEVHLVSTGRFKGIGVPGTQITDDQLGSIQREIDAYYDLFIEAVARGRGMSTERARELGDGAVHIGAQAVAQGLADGIGELAALIAELNGGAASVPSSVAATAAVTVPQASGAPEAGVRATAAPPHEEPMSGTSNQGPQEPMTAERFKAEHPGLYAAVREAAVKEGAAQERARMSELFDACPDAHRELLGKLVKDGLSVADGLKAILADDRRMRGNRLAAITGAASDPVGVPAEPAKPAAPGATVHEFASDQERWKAEFEKLGGELDGKKVTAAELRAEFGDLKYYLAHRAGEAAGAFTRGAKKGKR